MADPSEPALPVDSVQTLLTNALIDAGIVGADEAPEQPYLDRAFRQANWLLAQWARKRWLCYRLAEYSFVSTGALTYSVGKGQTVDINPRPDRVEYAFLRFLNNPQGNNLNVDIPISVIPSRENYSRITVKNIGTIAWKIFYDPVWPVGVLYPWPVPQASIYAIYVGFKVVVPRFSSLQQPINFPPEYEAALNWTLVNRLRASYQLPADPTSLAIARDSLNAMRLANQAVGVLQLPAYLTGRNRAYSYQSDDAADY